MNKKGGHPVAENTCVFCTKVTDTVWLFFMQYVAFLRKKGFAVMVIAGAGNHKEDLLDAGVPVMEVPFRFTVNPLGYLRLLKQTRELLEGISPRMVIVSDPTASFVGRIAAKKAGVSPIIYYCQGLPFAPHSRLHEKLLYARLEKYALRYTDQYIVVNAHDRAYVREKYGREPFAINGAGVDTNRFRPPEPAERKQMRAKLCIEGGNLVAAFVGRLVPSKGVMDFLKAVHMMAASGCKEVTFLIAGGGALEKKVREYIDRYELQHCMKFLGYVRDMPSFYQAIDVLVLPTYYNEGLPVSITEAMASGVAVVASDTRGCHDVIRNGENGLLIPFKNPAAIAIALQRLIEDKGLRERFAWEGRALMEREFSYAQVTKQFDGIIESALR